MGEQPPFAGLGKLYFCRIEESDKEPQPLGEPITIKPGMLTYKDDEPSSFPKSHQISFNATMEEPSKELLEKLAGFDDSRLLVDVILRWRDPGRMPRKMKKAYRSCYPRNTKWTRKVANYIRRNIHTINNAELVITKAQRDRIVGHISAHINNGTK